MVVFDFYFGSIIGIFVFMCSLAFYFLPTIIAIVRQAAQRLGYLLA